jgi:hypothetical protein
MAKRSRRGDDWGSVRTPLRARRAHWSWGARVTQLLWPLELQGCAPSSFVVLERPNTQAAGALGIHGAKGGRVPHSEAQRPVAAARGSGNATLALWGAARFEAERRTVLA